MLPNFLYPNGCQLLPLASIDMNGRDRQDFGDLQKLATSLMVYGLIHPPTVDGSNKLIAGGRRIAAMKLLGCTSFPVLLREQIDAATIKEMELEENEQRLGMNWKEKTFLIAKGHMLRDYKAAVEGLPWSYVKTGEQLGISKTHVSHNLIVYNALVTGDLDIINAPYFLAAWEILIARSEALGIAESERRHMSVMKTLITGQPAQTHAGTIDPVALVGSDMPAMSTSRFMQPVAGGGVVVTPTAQQMESVFDFSSMFRNVDSVREGMAQLASASVDHVVTDPPYGIDMDNLDTFVNIDTVKDQHDVQENIDLFEPFLTQSYRVLKDGGFCVFWYDLDHHNRLQTIAETLGFHVQRWPIIWVKEHPCRNSAPEKNFTKTVEYAMVLYKGNAALNKPQTRCHISADGSLERKMYSNPFAKPFAVWKFILDAIAYGGQTILDPFAGQFSCPRAVINCGMKPLAMEKVTEHFNKGMDMVRDMVTKMTGGTAKFV